MNTRHIERILHSRPEQSSQSSTPTRMDILDVLLLRLTKSDFEGMCHDNAMLEQFAKDNYFNAKKLKKFCRYINIIFSKMPIASMHESMKRQAKRVELLPTFIAYG